MFQSLRRWVGKFFNPEVGRLAEAAAEAELEVLALRAALKDGHVRHLQVTNTLLEVIGAFAFRDGGEAARVVLSGELRAAAAASMTPRFEELDDGDVVVYIPSGEAADDAENDLGE